MDPTMAYKHGYEHGYEQGKKAAAKWISVEDRLPESKANVLVLAYWHEHWQPMIGWYSDGGKKWRVLTSHGERVPGGVTHWMPLPEPPRMDGAK